MSTGQPSWLKEAQKLYTDHLWWLKASWGIVKNAVISFQQKALRDFQRITNFTQRKHCQKLSFYLSWSLFSPLQNQDNSFMVLQWWNKGIYVYVHIKCVTKNEEYSKVKYCWFLIYCVGSVIYLWKNHHECFYLFECCSNSWTILCDGLSLG